MLTPHLRLSDSVFHQFQANQLILIQNVQMGGNFLPLSTGSAYLCHACIKSNPNSGMSDSC